MSSYMKFSDISYQTIMNKFLSPVSDGSKYTQILFCFQCFFSSQVIIFSWNKAKITSQGYCTPDFTEKKTERTRQTQVLLPSAHTILLGLPQLPLCLKTLVLFPRACDKGPSFTLCKSMALMGFSLPFASPDTESLCGGNTHTRTDMGVPHRARGKPRAK